MATAADDKPHVAFLGPAASYTHQAAVEHFNPTVYDLQKQRTIAGVFAAVQSSSAEFGVVPFENSSNGPVELTLDCLIDRQNSFPDVVVDGETFLDVRHCLLGHVASKSGQNRRTRISPSTSPGRLTTRATSPFPDAPRTEPEIDLQNVTDVYSHPQAFGQCRKFLSTYLKLAEQHEVSSTSEAASRVSLEKLDTSATSVAIASKLAAQVHGLDLLATGIQDQDDNTTRFLLLRKGDVSVRNRQQDRRAKWKALLAFSINHELAGALADALHVFKAHHLNLTSINSRPSRERPWHYVFLVEFECIGESDENQIQIEQALQALNSKTEDHKCLGYWEE